MINGKYLFELFPDFTEEEIIRAFNKLTEKSKFIIRLTFGDNLDKKGDTSNLDRRQKNILVTSLFSSMRNHLLFNASKNKKAYSADEEGHLSNSVVDDTFKKLDDYNPLSFESERKCIKRAKLSYFNDVDEPTRKKYFRYYCEVKPRFKKKFESADENTRKALLHREIMESKIKRDKFLLHNLKLINPFLFRYQVVIPKEDLMQEGNIGLMKALEKFDLSSDNKFSTYAVWWIRQGMSKYIANNKREIRIPANLSTIRNVILDASEKIESSLNRKPTIDELAQETGYTCEKVKRVLEAYQVRTISLSTTLDSSDGTGDTIENVIIDDNSLFEESVDNRIVAAEILEFTKELDERSRNILYARMGLLDGRVHSLKELGQEYGVSRNRISQIEKKALEETKQLYEEKCLRITQRKKSV